MTERARRPVRKSRGSRSGGREARRALRAAPLAQEIRPVRAGLEGGAYKPLSDADIRTIHGGALRVLEAYLESIRTDNPATLEDDCVV